MPRSIPILSILLITLAAWLPAQRPELTAARTALERERPQRALWYLEELREEDRNKPAVLRLETAAHRALGQYERVLSGATRLLEVTPDDLELRVWLGEALLGLGVQAAGEGRADRALGYREQARDEARDVLKRAPGHPEARALEAWSLADLGEMEAALELARGAVKSEPESSRPPRLLADMLELAGEQGEAIGVLNAAEQRLPGDGNLPLHRALIHHRAGHREEAVRALMLAVNAGALDDASRTRLGDLTWDVFLTHRDFSGAARFLDAWSAKHPKDPRPSWWKGYAAELAGESKTPRKLYREAWRKSGKTLGEAALHLGLLEAVEGQEKKALDYLRLSLELKTRRRPEVARAQDALNAIAQKNFKKGKFKRAAQVLEKHGIAGDPFDWVLRQNAGFLLREWGTAEARKKRASTARRLWERSAEHYVMASKRILESDAAATSIAQVLNDTGLMFHYHLDQIPRGVEYYREALEYDPRYIDALENLGITAMARKEWEEAIDWFDRALEVDPQRAVSKQRRVLARRALKAQRREEKGDGR